VLAKTGALALITPTGTNWSVVRVPVLSNKQWVTTTWKKKDTQTHNGKGIIWDMDEGEGGD